MAGDIKSNKAPLSEEDFRKNNDFSPPKTKNIWQKAKTAISIKNLKIQRYIPAISWIPQYKWQDDMPGDIVAGLTVGILHIPHALAYSPLGRQAPVVGLNMALFPLLPYILLGTSRHFSLGTYGILLIMVGNVVDKNMGRGYSPLEIGIALAFLTGTWQLLFGFLNLGFLCRYFSQSMMDAFSQAASIHILYVQFKFFLDISSTNYSGPFKLIYLTVDYCKNLIHANYVTLLLSVVVLTTLEIFNIFLKPKIAKYSRFPVPFDLIVICTTTVLSFYLDLHNTYGVSVVGKIPTGLPQILVPPAGLFSLLLVDSFVIAFVAIAINISFAAVFAKKGNYELDINQELRAYGISNIFSSFFQCAPSCSAISRSALQYGVGGKTQFSSVYTCSFSLCVLLFAGKYLQLTPMCVLAAIVFSILRDFVAQARIFPSIWKKDCYDGFTWISTYLAVLIIDVDYGVIVGLAASLLTLIMRANQTQITVLGKIPNKDIYKDHTLYKTIEIQPYILIMQINGSINFVNCQKIAKNLLKEVTKHSSKGKSDVILTVVLDFSTVSYVDSSALEDLINFYENLKNKNQDLFLADCKFEIYERFECCNFFSSFPRSHVVVNVKEALVFLNREGEINVYL